MERNISQECARRLKPTKRQRAEAQRLAQQVAQTPLPKPKPVRLPNGRFAPKAK